VSSLTTLPAYNGWTNYPTWAVALWVDNDEGLTEERDALVQNYHDDAYELSVHLREWVEQLLDSEGGSLQSDLLGFAVAYVDWDDLARSWRRDITTSAEDRCESCGGTGDRNAGTVRESECPDCNGTGTKRKDDA
jgi:hypothetical protein